MIGELIAERYEVEEQVGTGGMANVFRAHDTVLERPVALKILHEHFSSDPEYVERFRREARAIAQLSHPNIVTVIDRGEFAGRQYIVFEHVPGENLKELVEREGPLDVDEALELTAQVARGLVFAHEHGIVHRDVKPQNVLLDPEGTAKVTDFGIARSLDPQDGLTQTGSLLGTSDYLSPEQASGQPVDERSDQYSLGVLLYEVLTGSVPFPGETFMAVAMRHLRDPVPSARALRPDIPERVDAIVARALAKRPGDRFPTTAAMLAEIEACLDGGTAKTAAVEGSTQEIPAPPPAAPTSAPGRLERPPRSRRRGVAPLLAAVVLAAGALAVFLLLRQDDVDDSVAAAGGDVVRLEAVSDYDPEGGDGEHPEDVPAATDGDVSTSWTTESYSSFSKSGVGIVLDARRKVELASLTIVSDEPGFTAVIRAGDGPDGGFEDASSSETVGSRTTFELTGDAHRYYLVWITDPNGRAHVNEVRARSD
jgi:eukaryotic-like serine/threonine-protein kinase